jgi:hypothetical protein
MSVTQPVQATELPPPAAGPSRAGWSRAGWSRAGWSRDRLCRCLLVLAAVAAAVAAVSDLPTVLAAGRDTAVVETWRLYGFVLFTGLFACLAVRPYGHRGIWELVIANKLALTITGIVFAGHGGVTGAAEVVIWDGSLTVLLVAAYAAGRCWRRSDR